MNTSTTPDTITLAVGPALADAITTCVKADIPFLLEGTTGIGKSHICEQVANALGIQYQFIDLSIMEPTDLLGLPQINGDKVRYATPSFLPTDGKGLLVFEELNRCQAQVRAPALQLLTARRLQEYVLPKGWAIGAAINPSDGDDDDDIDYIDTHPLDAALLARFCNLRVKADVGQWLIWAKAASIHLGVQDFVRDTPNIFDASNPRAWAMVSQLLLSESFPSRPRPVQAALISGLINQDLAGSFMDHLTKAQEGPDTQLPEADEFLADTKDRKKYTKLIEAAIAQKLNVKVAALVHQILILLQDPTWSTRLRDKKLPQLSRLEKVLPPELRRQLAEAIKEAA